jgi:hypothetical protein
MRARTHFQRFRWRRIPFSCFASPYSFSAVARAPGPDFMFCVPVLFFGGTEDVGSRFHVLRVRTRFRWYGGRRVPYSCFARPDSFSSVQRASGPVLMFCAPRLVFGGTEGVGSSFHVLRVRTHFRRYRRRQVPFFMFCAPRLVFSAVPSVSGSIIMFCVPRLIFGGTDGVGSRFHVFRVQTRFRRYGGRRVPFSCFARPDSFSAVPRAFDPVFMFCVSGLIFGGSQGVGSRFHVLHARASFWRYRGHRVPFSCFARPDSFSALRRASGLVFVFFAPGLVFGDTEGVGSRFHVLCSRTHFRRYRGRQVPFSCFAPRLIFGSTEGVRFLFHVLRSQIRFRQYRERTIPFSSFASPDSFSAVPRASGPVYKFCAPGLVFGGTDGVGSRFHVLRALTRFRRCRGSRVPFSCFARPHSFFEVPRASGPIFMFCAPGLVFDSTAGVGSHFHILRACTRFLRYRGRRFPFSCFACPDSFSTVSSASGPYFMFCSPNSFSAVPRESGPFFMLCAPGLVFSGSDGVGSRFYVLSPRTLFRR